MKYKNQIQHIEKLRKLPKHGQDAGKEAGWNIDEIIKTIKGSNKDAKNFVTTLSDMAFNADAAQSGLAGLIALQQKMNNVTVNLVKSMTQIEDKFKNVFKQYKVGANNANLIAKNQAKLAKHLGTTVVNTDKYIKTLTRLLPLQAKNLNINNEAFKQDSKTLDVLQKRLGVSEELAAGYISFAAVQGKSSEEVLANGIKLSEFLESKGLVGVLPEITEQIGSLGSDLRLQYGRLGGNLEVAVLKARQLGISVKDLAKTGENFLSIEQSVGKELEYQLLTGNRLLTQDGKSLTAEYRKATMMGDSNKQAELMQKLIQDEGANLEKNLFARKQMADLLGMNEAQLGAMLEKQKLMSKYGIGEEAFELDPSELEKALKASTEMSAKEIEDTIDKMDTRTTQEIALEQLQATEDLTLLLSDAFTGGTMFQTTRDSILGDKGFLTKITDVTENLAKNFEGTTTAIGKLGNLATVTGTVTEKLGKLEKFIPFVEGTLGKFTGQVKKYSDAIGTTLTMTNRSSTTTDATGNPKSQDMIWRPGAPPQRFSSGDLAFLVDGNAARPAGAGAAASGAGLGGGGSIDYNKLAAAMANVQITIDPLYSSTTMNNGTFTA